MKAAIFLSAPPQKKRGEIDSTFALFRYFKPTDRYSIYPTFEARVHFRVVHELFETRCFTLILARVVTTDILEYARGIERLNRVGRTL